MHRLSVNHSSIAKRLSTNYTLIAATQSPTKPINGTKSKAAARAGIRLGFAQCAAQPWPPQKKLALRKSSEKFD